MTEGRWRDGKLGLVHQLVRFEQRIEQTPARYHYGSVSSYYSAAIERVIVRWLPLCGIRRKKDKRQGYHNGPLTCLFCIGRLS